jgi:PPOX class probable F420-dependent enzyme
MAVLSDAARTILESGRLAHVVTLNSDGSPQVTLVWIGLDGDEIVSGHLGDHLKLRNVRRDPRVVVSVESDGMTNGLHHYLVIRGRARVTEGGAPELLQRLAHVYLGPEVSFPPPGAPGGYVLRITPERVGGVGPGAEPVRATA